MVVLRLRALLSPARHLTEGKHKVGTVIVAGAVVVVTRKYAEVGVQDPASQAEEREALNWIVSEVELALARLK